MPAKWLWPVGAVIPIPSPTTTTAQSHLCNYYLLFHSLLPLHCKASEVNTSLKTASCEAGPGTTLMYSLVICSWSLLIQEFDDGCCFLISICYLPKCHLYKEYMKLLNTPGRRIEPLTLQ
jgi:hypothetical protein